jgi:uncharacterized lipoprotein YmbA
MRLCLTILGLIFLAGCGSSPKTHFYALETAPGATGRWHTLSYPVQLTAVHVPPSLDRRQMVSMTGPNQVAISETNQWSAPLDIMMRNILAADLVSRLSRDRVILPEAPAPEGTATLVVTITRFAPEAGGELRFAGSWSLLRGGNPVKERQFEFRRQAPGNPGSTAGAMSEMLGELADQIAATLASAD